MNVCVNHSNESIVLFGFMWSLASAQPYNQISGPQMISTNVDHICHYYHWREVNTILTVERAGSSKHRISAQHSMVNTNTSKNYINIHRIRVNVNQ